MAKAVYIVGIIILAVLVGAVFYSWLGGEQSITTAATASQTSQKTTEDVCPAAASTTCYSAALADKLVGSCSRCHKVDSKCRADYVAVSCS
jgi:hypothetical protein